MINPQNLLKNVNYYNSYYAAILLLPFSAILVTVHKYAQRFSV